MADLLPAAEVTVISLDQQIRSVEREIGLRIFWYPKWVESRKLSQKNADHELAAMRAVLRTLQSIRENASA